MGGHSGFFRTYKRLAAVLLWDGMKRDIQRFVAECDACQRVKYDTHKPASLLQPLRIPKQVWDDVSLDFIRGLPKALGRDTIMVVMDRLTEYVHFFSLSHPLTAHEITNIFVQEVVRLHGFSRSIVSDRDHVFISNFWKELF